MIEQITTRTKWKRTLCGAAAGMLCGVMAMAQQAQPREEPARPGARLVRPALPPTHLDPPAPKPTKVVDFKDGCMSAECHVALGAAPVVHEPTRRGACDVCHGTDTGGHHYPIRADVQNMCESCHQKSEHRAFTHKAMAADGCLTCHNPHASAVKALLIGADASDTCLQCHQKSAGTVQHKPYAAKQCDDCHDPHGADNPMMLVGGEGEALCMRCHGDVAKDMNGRHSHRGAKGSCLACHAPHASNHPALLAGEPKTLCITCHSDVGKAVTGAPVAHDPVLKDHQCITCHVPHGTDNPRMLRDGQAAVCGSCHNRPIKAGDGRQVLAMPDIANRGGMVHGAVRQGDCSECHAVHGGEQSRLLREANPRVPLEPYDAKNYGLCFSCHDPALVDSPLATYFRNGDHNLHDAHLRGGAKSRGCGSCHAVHSSDLPRLIAKNVNFEGSGWNMPMKFVMTPEGGSCASACHEELGYRRDAGGGTKSGGDK